MAKSYSSYTKAYNKYLNQYTKELNEYEKAINQYNSYVPSTSSTLSYSFNPNSDLTNSIYEGLVNLNSIQQFLDIDKDRTMLDRTFDILSVGKYASAGFVRGFVDEDITPFEGLVQGIVAGNPFGDGIDKWEYNYSGVLEEAGWKPQSLGGKIARGTVGLALDIFLDPLTYTGGGLGGLFKGTGKHSAKAALGVSDDITKGLKMTQEVAEDVIKNTRVFKNGMVEVDLVQEATELMNKYNKLIGINSKDATRTLSLANAPFGKKIFGKYADKSITLIDSDSMKALGDATIAPVYGRIRDKVFGGQIGKMFSTNHPLYQLSKTNPEQLFYALKKESLDVGQSIGKLNAEQFIRNNAELFGDLSPAQNKQIIDALEDKTIYHQIKKTVNFVNTKEASRYAKQIEATKELTQKRIDNLTDYVEKAKEGLKNTNLSIDEQNNVLNLMKEDYLSELLSVNEVHAVELGKVQEVMREMIKANESLNPNGIKNFSKLSDELININGVNPENLVKRYYGLSDEVIVRNADIEAKKTLFEAFTTQITIDDSKYISEFDDYIKFADNLEKPVNISSDYMFKTVKKAVREKGFVEYGRQDYIDKVTSAFPDWTVTKMSNGKTRIIPPAHLKKAKDFNTVSAVSEEIYDTIKGTSKSEIIDDLSTYLFGQKGFISQTTLDDNIGKIIKQIEEGKSVEETLNFIFNNRELYNGASKEMYGFIAETVGYKNWDDYYTKPMGRLAKQYRVHSNKTNPNSFINKNPEALKKLEAEIIKLKKDELKRNLLINEFKGRTTLSDVAEVTGKFRDETFQTRELPEIIDTLYHRGIRGETIDELSRSGFNIESYLDSNKSATPRQFEKTLKGGNPKLSKKERDIAIDFYTNHFSGKAVKNNKINLSVQANNLKEINNYKKQITHLDSEIKKLLTNSSSDDVANEILVRRNKISELNKKITSLNKSNEVMGSIVKSDPSKEIISPLKQEYFNKLINNVEEMLTENNQTLGMLDESHRNELFTRAIKRSTGKSYGKASEHTKELFSPKVQEVIDDVAKSSNKKAVHDKIFDTVKRNNKIQFFDKGELKEGFVNRVHNIDGEKTLEVIVDGNKKMVTKGIFQGRLIGNKIPESLDDIRDVSQLYDEFIVKHNDLSASIDEAKKLFANQEELYNKSILDIKKSHNSNVRKLRRTTNKKLDDVHKIYNSKMEEINSVTLELEKKSSTFRDMLNLGVEDDILKYQDELAKYDILLNNSSAFETYVRSLSSRDSQFVDDIVNKYNPNVGEYVIRDDLGFDDAVKNSINQLREEFLKFGEGEVGIGKLSQEQFDNLMYEYVPRILTPEGEELFLKNKDVFKKFQGFGDDFGYGREFNPFQKSRNITKIPDGNGGWINNPTISEINNYFNQFTDGKDVFKTNVAEIYVARAMKHNDLMYDNKYMENMLELFGEDYTGVKREGFTTVMNYGKLKQVSSDIVGINTSLDISDEVSNFLIENKIPSKAQDIVHEMIRTNPEKYKGIDFNVLVNKEIGKQIDDFMKTYLTPEVRHRMYVENLESFFNSTNTHGMLDDIATPMVQFSDGQVKSVNTMFDSTRERLIKHINKRVGIKSDELIDVKDIEDTIRNAINKGNLDEITLDKMNRVLKKIDMFNEFQPPQIKDVNDAIVLRANQSRKLQIINDNNKFLTIYDKVTHFMKLNQTTVSPAFHVRNKMSNVFNNSLEIGYDAIDVEFQKKTLAAMKGNLVDELFEITNADGSISKIKWKDLYQAAQDYGAIDSGVFARDIGAGASSKGLLRKLGISGKFDPTNTKEFIGYTYGKNVGNIVENHDRFIHFASQVKRGMNFKDAAESVNKFLFNYSDLTMFEQSVMKRVLPYYTWLRKNSQLQLEMIIENPGMYRNISKVIGGIESMVDEKDRIDKRFVNDFAKDWVQTPFYVTNPEGRQEPVLWNPNLPFMDINRIPDPTRPMDSVRDLFTQTNPLIKVPIELALNRDFFFDSPISKDGENKLGNSVEHVARQFAVYPITKGMVEKQGLDFGLHMLNTTSGVKLLSYDYDKYKAMKISEMSKKKERSKTNPGILDSIKRKLGGY